MTEPRPKTGTLVEYAKTHPRRHRQGFILSLPVEIQEQVHAGAVAGIGVMTIYRWLRELGYEEATYGKVWDYIRDHVRS